MFKIILLFLFVPMLVVASVANWKMIGETVRCKKLVQIKAKVGEKSIRAYMNGKSFTLFPEGNYVFMEKSPINQVFDSYNRKSPSDIRLIYHHASAAMPDSSIMYIHLGKDEFTCKVSNEI